MKHTARHREMTLKPYTTELVENEQYGVKTYVEAEVGFDNMVCDDIVTSDYHKWIKQGVIINNPCTITRSSLTKSGYGSISYATGYPQESTQKGAVTCRLWGAGHQATIPDVNLPSQEDRVKLVALANVDSTPYAFGEDAGELRETFRFIRKPLASIGDLSVQFRRSYRKKLKQLAAKDKYWDFHNAHKLLEAHASVWLQYRFALSPLVRSTIDGLDAYSSKTVQLPERLSARGKSETSSSATDPSALNPSLNYRYNIHREKVREDSAHVLYTVTNPITDWRYRLGFRPKDFPTTMWQLMPYSFMVDRLLDVSSFLKGAINLGDPMVTILAASYRYKLTDSVSVTLNGRDHATTVVYSGDTRKEDNFTYSRSVWNPTIRDTIPGFTPVELIKDATNITDLVSLIVSNFNPFSPVKGGSK